MCAGSCLLPSSHCVLLNVQMIVVDVYNARFHRVYTDRDSLSLIMDRDDIFVYELSVCSEGQDMIHLPVYHREETCVSIISLRSLHV